MKNFNYSFKPFIFILIFGIIYHSLILSGYSQPFDQDSVDVTKQDELSYLDSAILGVVEGLTEYLPVSSTGHLILADRIIGGNAGALDDQAQVRKREARNAYLIVIQGGAILAVLFIYWNKVLSILMGLLGKNPKGLALGLRVLVAFIPAAILGPIFDDMIESKLFNPTAVSIALFAGAIVMILVEWKRKPENQLSVGVSDVDQLEELSYKSSLLIGFMQCFAMWPGMSRSMVTIVGGYFVGLKSKAAAEFSFLLGLLTLTAASVYSLLGSWDVMVEQIEIGPSVFGLVVATIVAFVAVKWFVAYLAKHGLIIFAIYRILLAGVILWTFRT